MFKKALISSFDILTTVDEPVTIELMLERRIIPFIDPPLAFQEVELHGVGTTTTDAAGKATFDLGPLEQGVHHYRALAEKWSAQTKIYVHVMDRDRPVFVTDIDGTIADCSNFGFVVRPPTSVSEIKGAPEALKEIANTMEIVYLTARDHIFSERTRRWLRHSGFPEGTLYLRRERFWSVSPKDHKIRRLREFCRTFRDVRWGVGDTRGDMEAYESHAIRPILLAKKSPAWLPKNGICLPTWKDIGARVLER